MAGFASRTKANVEGLLKNPNSISEYIKNKDNFVFAMLGIFILTLIVFSLVYYFYVHNLQYTECKTMDHMYGDLNTKIHSLNNKDPNNHYGLRDYYIKTAYNCCSAGAYKNDWVSLCSLRDVLKQGVRGLDFEIYSVGDKPVVATSSVGSYYVKETYNYVDFADVMETIKTYAFSTSTAPNPDDPIIFHMRIMSNNNNMFSSLAKIFKAYEEYFLGDEYSFEYGNNTEDVKNNLGAVPILTFKKKIIVIVDNSNKVFSDKENHDFYEFVNLTSNSIFMRALNYYDVKNTPDLIELQEYNKQNMTIAMPNISANPSNPSAIVARETGCQMIAMCYQVNDIFLQENNQFFDNNGSAFVLKPEKLRYIPVTIPAPPPPDPALSFETRTVSSPYYSFNI
jgi:hypothetical protein